MANSTKLKVCNKKMYQGKDDTITISGETIIHVDTSNKGIIKYSEHPNFTGATYNIDTILVDKKYVDEKVFSADTIYNLTSPATINLGGISKGYELTGKETNLILKNLLVPALEPILTMPSNTFVFDDGSDVTPDKICEVGSRVKIIFKTVFNGGTINPYYDENKVNKGIKQRSGLPIQYIYTGSELTDTISSSISRSVTINAYTVLNNVDDINHNKWSSSVSYNGGTLSPRNSEGDVLESPLSASTTQPQVLKFTGILPYFYGTTIGSLPIINQALVDGATKKIENSNGDIVINYGVFSESKYLWFAIPKASTQKQGYSLSIGNYGGIGKPSDLFGSSSLHTINSPTSFWTGEEYRFYVSTFPTTLNNSITITNRAQ